MSKKKLVFLVSSIVLIVIIITYSVWAVITPKWHFSVTTDKSTYGLGEDVKITVTLSNMGFITHSFKSLVSDPVLVHIQYQYPENPTITSAVWFSPIHESITEFSVEPSKSLERSFIWNQTNAYFPEKEIEQGSYIITVFIPSDDPNKGIAGNYLFVAGTRISITAA